jgi:transcriptional regulator PpsR
MTTQPDRAAAARLSDFAPELASTVVRVAGDIAFVVGEDGVIHSVAHGQHALPAVGADWVGQPWAERAGAAARQKVELLLQEAQNHGVSRRREFDHAAGEGQPIPVSWAAVRLGDRGPVLVVGRDLRAVSAIQQQFLDAQQELERAYWHRRQAETHYQQLFQVAHDAVLVLDAGDFTVLEANPAASPLFGAQAGTLENQTLHRHVDTASWPVLDELLATVRTTGVAAEIRLRLAGRGLPIDLSATPFRAESRMCLLLRARRVEPSSQEPRSVLEFMGQTPDAVVVTDSSSRVLWANPAFETLCGGATEAQLRGRPLADAVGGDSQQWSSLLARVRARGIVGQSTVSLRGGDGAALSVSVSAALLAEGDQEHIGFTLRPLSHLSVVRSVVGADADPAPAAGDDLLEALAGLVQRLGQAPLTELLAQAGRLAETHLIQAALRTHAGAIEPAAAMLGLTPASLLARLSGLDIQAPSSAE